MTAKRKIKEGPLEKKWHSFTGTGITANRGDDALALRKGIGGGEFAIVELFGGCWTNSPMQVIEEIETASLETAKSRFHAVAEERGFKEQPIRGVGLLFA